jgi:hypothetical protein
LNDEQEVIILPPDSMKLEFFLIKEDRDDTSQISIYLRNIIQKLAELNPDNKELLTQITSGLVYSISTKQIIWLGN